MRGHTKGGDSFVGKGGKLAFFGIGGGRFWVRPAVDLFSIALEDAGGPSEVSVCREELSSVSALGLAFVVGRKGTLRGGPSGLSVVVVLGRALGQRFRQGDVVLFGTVVRWRGGGFVSLEEERSSLALNGSNHEGTDQERSDGFCH